MRLTFFILSMVACSFVDAGVAAAYCRTKTCELGIMNNGQACPPSTDACRRDEQCCAIDGADLAWASPCLQFAVQRDGSPRHGIDANELGDAVLAAFDSWRRVDCAAGGHPRFQARLSGLVTCDERQTLCRGASENVSTIIAHDQEWIYGPSELGVTNPTAVVATGEIVDADLELNLTEGSYSVTKGTPGYEALTYVLTHEIGHFLGLGHSDQLDAVMYYSYQSTRPVDTLLSEDDIAAVCAVFPPSDEALTCADVEDRGPAYDECKVPADDGATEEDVMDDACLEIASMRGQSRGCSISAVAGTGERAGLLALALLFIVRRMARRRLPPT